MPPRAPAASMAVWIALVSLARPLPRAPNCRTLNRGKPGVEDPVEFVSAPRTEAASETGRIAAVDRNKKSFRVRLIKLCRGVSALERRGANEKGASSIRAEQDKSETRNPRPEGGPKPEIRRGQPRSDLRSASRSYGAFELRISDSLQASNFGFRIWQPKVTPWRVWPPCLALLLMLSCCRWKQPERLSLWSVSREMLSKQASNSTNQIRL